MKKRYYACLQLIGTNSWTAVVRIPFETREEARDYIHTHFDADFHSKCWTE